MEYAQAQAQATVNERKAGKKDPRVIETPHLSWGVFLSGRFE